MNQSLEPGPADAAGNLRAHSDVFMAQLERLTELEHTKRDIPPSDPRFLAIARQVEDAARSLFDGAREQAALGYEAHVDGLEAAIALIPPDLSAAQIIAGWRDAERHLATLDPASVDARTARLTIEAYRRAYQMVFGERQKGESPGRA